MQENAASWNEELTSFCRTRGADLVPVRDFILSQGLAMVGWFPRAVSLCLSAKESKALYLSPG